MFIYLFAHADEVHVSTFEKITQDLAWYVQLPLFFAIVVAFAYLMWRITKRKDRTALITATALLITGFAMFQIAPIVSAAAITVGLVSSLLVTLLGLGSPEKS